MATTMHEDEKKSNGSVDTDLEAVLWSDDPETAYFRQMLEDKQMDRLDDDGGMDDSVLGTSTINDLMGVVMVQDSGSPRKQLFGGAKSSDDEDDDDDDEAAPGAHPRMAIIGLEDDLSTIANDTIGGDMTGRGFPSQPRNRDFNEYHTPEKQKRNGGDDDEDTQPETPPGMIRVPQKGEKVASNAQGGASTRRGPSLRSKRIYLFALFMGLILLVAIVALAVILAQLRQDNDTSGSAGGQSIDGAGVGGADSGSDNALDFGFGTRAPVSTNNPYDDFAGVPSVSTGSPVAAPVSTPDVPATPTPDEEKEDADATTPTPEESADPSKDFFDLLASRSLDTLETLEDRDSPQYQSFEWVTSDPNYYDYGPDRVIQRWVLGTFYLGLSENMGNRELGPNVLTNWMTEEDECLWYSTKPNEQPVCNENGLLESLDIRDASLYGTFPAELALLSNSLTQIHLSGNNLFGNIPSNIGDLTLLERFQITSNLFEGTIATEVGRLSNLNVFGVGRNLLTGTFPTELGSIEPLDTISVAANSITGTIPKELGDLENLRFLNFSENMLTGRIPWQLGEINTLESLKLGSNQLTGEMPEDICDLKNLDDLVADCREVECDCCSACNFDPTESPTARITISPFPTAAPIKTPSPTATPTNTPTTATPTVCVDEIEVVQDCFHMGDKIVVNFVNCNPRNDDWIGLYSEDADPEDLGYALLWQWACGDQACRGEAKSGTVSLDFQSIGEPHLDVWPLQKDRYKVYLIRRNPGGPYSGYAETERFKVKEDNC